MGRQGLQLAIEPTALLQRCAGEPFAFAVDGAGTDSWDDSHAVVGFAPRAVLRVDSGGHAVVRRDTTATRLHGDPLTLLEGFVAEHHTGADPRAAFVVAALSYELRRHIEPRLRARPCASGEPLLHAAAYDWLLVWNAGRRSWELRARPGADVDLDAVAARIRELAARPAPPAPRPTEALRPDLTAAQHEDAVRRALDYIGAGDIYQVNFAQRFRVDGRVDAAGLFAALQRSHPVPFAAYVDAGDFALVSSSPECFLRRDGDEVATQPIKGTRPRAVGAEADARLRRELLADAKERAEHVMIIDLERNDLGRVCRTGSVVVPESMRVETFPSLHHLVSEVRGVLRPGIGLSELLRATFPGGSITGAPKIRAMEIIDEIEVHPRGFYTGAIGLLGRERVRLSIAIRTATVRANELLYHAGGGIVADSDPRREYEEVLLKTLALAQALAQPRAASAA